MGIEARADELWIESTQATHIMATDVLRIASLRLESMQEVYRDARADDIAGVKFFFRDLSAGAITQHAREPPCRPQIILAAENWYAIEKMPTANRYRLNL